MNVIFKKSSKDNYHYRELRKQINHVLKSLPQSRKYKKKYFAIGLPLFYLTIYVLALQFSSSKILFYSLYSLLGITSVLIFVNIIHDAVHNNIFKSRRTNNALILIFDCIGGNSFIWKKRHMLLHHNYQNIPGWDSDIEQAGLIKIFPNEKASLINKYQHYFIFLFYPLYLFNWILIRDFKDFFLKNRQIKKVCKIPTFEYIKLFFFKSFFIFYMAFIPILLGVEIHVSITALCFMFVSGSIFAMLSLLTPHVNDKNEFPIQDSEGKLNISWLEHQFITTNDLSLSNWFTRNLMGNFNFHLSHHLFPKISSVYAQEVTKVIQDYANENGFSYRTYKLTNALKYHYKLIKANALDLGFFEEDM
ncbi:MAG TPA: fatty acid desaturase [Flavobacteriaceae bacterium]|nr:fatty acid desaturase [Flavobacteriaceae bacterium]